MADTVASLLVEINGDASGLESAIRSVSGSLQALGKSGAGISGTTKKAIDDVSKGTQSYALKLQETGKKIKSTGEAIDTVTKPLQHMALVTAAGGVAAAKFAIDFEDNFAAVKKTVDGTPEQLEAVRQGIIDLTTVGINGRNPIPQTTKELTELAAAGGQLGIKTENIVDFTEVMAQLGTATNLSGETGAATLARLMNVTNTSQDKVRNLGSTIVDLGNNFATTEAEIADMSLSMGATGVTVRMSTQDVLGYATALSSMGIEAEAGGSALQRIWMGIQNAVSSGGEDLATFAKTSGKSAEEFKKQWQQDATGAFNDFLQGLNKSSDKVGVLNELGFNNVRDQKALLALAGEKGFGILTEAIERANKAWDENTALQNEFNAKSETTASKLQITKNNIVEAARSIGETMLPTIKDLSTGAAEFAQKLAGLDEGAQQKIVKTGLAIISAGAAAKGLAGSFKTVGAITEGFGKLAQLAPGISKIGPAIKSGITSPVGIAAAAVAGLAIISKITYDSWYDSNYKWSKGLSEGNEKVRESVDEYKKLSQIKNEVKDLKATITNPDASTEQVDEAKSKLEEIKKLLSEEYNLVIKSNNSNLDEAIDSATRLSKNELQTNINNQMAKLAGLREKMASYDGDYNADYSKYQNALNEQTKYSDMKNNLSAINAEYKNGNITLGERNNKVRELAKAYGFADEAANSYGHTVSAIDEGYSYYSGQVEKYGKRLGDLVNAQKEYVAVSTEMANWNTELLNMAALEGDSESTQKYLANIGQLVRDAGLDMTGYAQAAALAMNNVQSLDDAWAKGGGTLDGVTNDYIRAMKEFGASAQDTAVGAALIKNGFRDIGEAANAGKLDTITQQANDLAHTIGLLPESKSIVISASGDISVAVDAKKAVDEVNKAGNVRLSVSADGDISVLDSADEKLTALAKNNLITVSLNVDTGGFDINDLDGNKIGEITAEGKITWVTGEIEEPEISDAEGKVNYETGETPETVPDASGNANFGLGAHPEKVPDASGNANFALGTHPEKAPDIHGTAYYKVVYENVQSAIKPGAAYPWAAKKATGDSYFKGGLAMVNDQKGIADPRELILDNGRAFIPDGRDVILPLSKGAKVYTASQTKRIMQGIGIPRYASGKDNSKGFIAAAESWGHYKNTHSVSIGQELQQWLDFQKQFKKNAEDIKDIEEQVFLNSKEAFTEQMTISQNWLKHQEKYTALSYEDKVDAIRRIEDKVQKAYDKGLITEREYLDTMQEWDEEYLDSFMDMIDKKRKESADYISLHTLKNDWSAIGDDPLAAYSRVKERELWEFDTTGDWETYYSHISELSDDMLGDMVSQAKEALDLQQKYFGLSAREYLDGIDEMIAKTNEFYDNLDVSAAKRAETDKELYTTRLDAQRAVYDDYIKSANDYFNIRETFDDWDEVNDSKTRFYLAELANIEKMYREHNLGWQDYMDESLDKYLSLYRAVGEEYDDILQGYTDRMSEISSEYADKRSLLQSEWDQSDRDEDIDEVNRLIGIYKNAVTDEGQKKYKDLLDQKKQLERDQELTDIEAEEKAELENIQKLYDKTEAEKTQTLKSLQRETFNVFSKAEDINFDTGSIKELAEHINADASGIKELADQTAGSIIDTAAQSAVQNMTLSDILKALNKIADKVDVSPTAQSVYYNNGTYTINNDGAARELIKRLTGTVVSGLGSVMIG